MLCEDHSETVLKPGDAAGWKADSRDRPLPDQPHAAATRSTSRSAPARRIETAVYPDIDMRAERDKTGMRYRAARPASLIRCGRPDADAEDRPRQNPVRQQPRPIRRNSPPSSPAARSRSSATRSGLTQFGVNISRIKANSKSALRHWHESEDEFIYMLEGELVLHEDAGETVLKPGDAAGWTRQRRHRPLPDQPHRHGRALSRSRHPLEGRARALSRRRFPHGARRQGPPLDAQVRRADQGVTMRGGAWPTISSSTSMPTASRSSPGTCPGAR